MPGVVALLYVIVAPTLMGALVTVTLLVEKLYTGVGIGAAAGLGALLALPASWLVAREIRRRGVAGGRPA